MEEADLKLPKDLAALVFLETCFKHQLIICLLQIELHPRNLQGKDTCKVYQRKLLNNDITDKLNKIPDLLCEHQRINTFQF